MPRLTRSVPKYRKHRASGQAIVTLDGRDFYLGPHGTKASRIEYDRLVGEWITNDRRLPTNQHSDIAIAEICALYWKFAEKHYCKRERKTSELGNIKYALRPLNRLYGQTPVRDFGPLALKALQAEMIRENLSRGVINSRIGKIKRLFKWAVSEQLAPPSLCHALATVQGLQRGRTEAREAEPVKPVEESVVAATMPFLPAVVADMVRFQRLVGCRPEEVCALRPCDVDRAREIWEYQPASHKTEHHGRRRSIYIGPKAQNILRPYLLRPADSHCFSPAKSEARRKAELRAKRKTKVQPSQLDRSKTKGKKKPGDRYSGQAYLWAIRRACLRAGITPWSPNRLRHSAATEIRGKFGLDAAQVVLGHASADVTQVYAERYAELAREVVKQIG